MRAGRKITIYCQYVDVLDTSLENLSVWRRNIAGVIPRFSSQSHHEIALIGDVKETGLHFGILFQQGEMRDVHPGLAQVRGVNQTKFLLGLISYPIGTLKLAVLIFTSNFSACLLCSDL